MNSNIKVPVSMHVQWNVNIEVSEREAENVCKVCGWVCNETCCLHVQ